jgi:hypothetical protein
LAWKQLMIVQPASDARPLKPVMQQTGKRLVLMAVADEARMELNGLVEKSWRIAVRLFLALCSRASCPLVSKASSLLFDPCHVREKPARRRKTPSPTGTRRPTCRPGRRSAHRRISRKRSPQRPTASIPRSHPSLSGMAKTPPAKSLKP